MTDEQINAEIAKACGWTNINSAGKAGRAPNADYIGCEFIPNYCHDLNAMHESEKCLADPAIRREYAYQLSHVSKGSTRFDTMHATARQRAEAFLRTLGKWNDQSGERTEMEVQK